MSLTKVLLIDQKSAPVSEGEDFCSLIDFDHREKLASELNSFMNGFKPKKGHVYLHTIALGAGEFYGPNRNADYFYEKDLKQRHETFVTHASVYRLHKNKPKKGHKKYGSIIHSWYNDRMHRVELIIELPEVDNPDVVDAIRTGKPICFSMGCRVAFDVCSICGNEAPEEEDYCEHVTPKVGSANYFKYGLNRILPDGRQICVYNPNPVFFDYSKVFRPADRTAYSLSKVAAARNAATPSAVLMNKHGEYKEKSAYLSKLSKIVKRFSGVPMSGKNDDMSDVQVKTLDKFVEHAYPSYAKQLPPISDDMASDLSKFPMRDVLSTFIDNGIFLTTPEFMRILFKKETGNDMPMGTLQKFMKMQGDMLQYFSKNPADLDRITDSGIYDVGRDHVRGEISDIIKPVKKIRLTIQILMPDKEKNAMIPTRIQRDTGLLPERHGKYTLSLPSGQSYQANVADADVISDEENTIQAVKKLGRTALPVLGGAGLLGMAWRKAGRGSRPWLNTMTRGAASIPIVGASALLAKHQWDKPSSTPYVKTDQGDVVPARAFRPSYEQNIL